MKIQKETTPWQWKTIEYISYIIVLFVPWWVSKNLIYSYTSPKALVLTFLVLLSVILALSSIWYKKDSYIKFNPVSIVLIVFLSLLTISSIFGVDPINSFFGWRYAVSLVHLYILGIFALVIGSLIRKNKKIIPNILLVSFISSIIVGIIFYTGLSFPTDDASTIGNNSYLGEYLFFNILFAFGLFLYYKEYWKKILVALGALFIFVSPVFINKDILVGKVGFINAINHPLIFMGEANGALMGIGLSILVFFILLLVVSRKKVLKITGFVLLASFMFGIWYAGQLLVNPDSKLHKVYVEQKSGNRFLAWDIAKESFKDNKLLGVGVNNYPYSFEKYSTTDFYKEGYFIERFNQPHNIYWEFASNTGILGLTSFLLLLFATVFFLLRKINEEDSSKFKLLRIALASIIFGYFIQNLFVFDTIATYLMLFLVIGITIGLSDISWDLKIGDKFDVLKKIFIAVVISGSLSSIVIFVFLPWSEAKTWNKMTSSTQNILDFYNEKKDIQGISVMGGLMDSTFISQRLFEPLQSNVKNVDNSNRDKFLKVVDYSASLVERDVEKQPGYADSYFMIGNLLDVYMLSDIKSGDSLTFDGKNYNKEVWDRAYKALEKSIELNPKNPKAYYALSKTYVIKGDMANARIVAKKAIDVAPWNKDSYKFAHVLFGGTKDAEFEKYVNDMEKKWITN